MSDNLRDRIAAVIAGIACCDTHRRSAEKFDLDAADAVIAELGLTRQTRSERVPKHRYVTEWKADDE